MASKRVKNVLRGAGAALALVAAIVVVNALRAGAARPSPPPPAHDVALDEDRIAAHLGRMIGFKTISHDDPASDDPAPLDAMQAALTETYPRLHAALARETIGSHGLVYTWKGADPSLAPILLAAHQDVVPVEPGTEDRWTHPPFSGIVADGYVWGRGALDDKGSLVAIFEAVEDLLSRGVHPRRTIVLAFGADEEVGGAHGAQTIAEAFERRGQRFDFALDEGGAVTVGVVPNVAAPIAVVGVAEKGYATVDLAVHTPTGHSSMPPDQTSIGILAQAVDRLERRPMPARMTPVTRAMLETIAGQMPLSGRLALANLWLFEPLVLGQLAGAPATNASIRTTTAPTVFQAGVKDNVLPSEARAAVNFRILPGDSVDGVVAHVREAIGDPRVEVSLRAGHPGAEPVSPSSFEGPAFASISRAIREVIPGAIPVPTITVGATDVRHYARVAGGTYRFVPLVFKPEEMKSLHGTNERLAVGQLQTAVRFYEDLIAGD